MHPKQITTATIPVIAALLSVVLWGAAPLLAEQARSIPAWHLTTLTLLSAAVVTLPLKRTIPSPKLSLRWRWALFFGVPLLITGAVGSYFVSMRIAPAAQAALITYTWPVLFVLISQLTLNRAISFTALLGALIAYLGSVILTSPQWGHAALSLNGYGFALLAAVCWALYSWLGKMAPVALTPLLSTLMFLAAGISAVLALIFNHGFITPDLWPVLAAVVLGLGPFGIAMIAWDLAVRFGPASLIASLAYGVPVIATVFLVLAGVTPLNWQLAIAAVLILTGSIVASRSESYRQ